MQILNSLRTQSNLCVLVLLFLPIKFFANDTASLPLTEGPASGQEQQTDKSTSFVIHGRLNSFSTGGSAPGPHTEADFEFARGYPQWRLKVEYLKLPGRGPIYREFAGDGLDVYQVTSWDRKMILESANGTSNTNTEIGRAYPGAIPTDAVPIDYAAWFAFAGPEYLASLTNDRMHNIFHDLETNSVLFEATFAETFPRMMETVRMFRPGIRLRPAAIDVNSGRVVKPPQIIYPAPFNDGFVGAAYTTTRWTNAQGHTFPKEFRLLYQDLRKDRVSGGAYRLETTAVIIGSVSDIKLNDDSQVFGPKVTSAMTFIDQRLNGIVGNAVYTSKTSGWLDRSDPGFTNKVAALRGISLTNAR